MPAQLPYGVAPYGRNPKVLTSSKHIGLSEHEPACSQLVRFLVDTVDKNEAPRPGSSGRFLVLGSERYSVLECVDLWRFSVQDLVCVCMRDLVSVMCRLPCVT